MRTISLPDDKLTAVLAALQHSASSEHHSACTIRTTMHCNCHVQKAKDANDIMREAARRRLVKASELKVGQWIACENALDQRIISITPGGGMFGALDVGVDYGGEEPRAVAEMREFLPNDEVLVVDPNV